MRLIITVLILATSTSVALAGDAVRVIPITKESAAESAKIISAAHLIGVPPAGKTIRSPNDWRNARAELLKRPNDQQEPPTFRSKDMAEAALPLSLSADHARVEIITPGKSEAVVQTYYVPKERR